MKHRPTASKSKFITSYDLLKSLAVISMIIDHIGYYMYPEVLWFRAVGRISFPIWFFLIGYAQSRTIGPRLLGGAVILALADGITGTGVFPLNVLFTIMLIRLFREPVMRKALAGEVVAVLFFPLILFLLMLPSFFVTEYGFQGLLAAMFGYIMRRKSSLPGLPGRELALIYLALVFASYIFQQIVFGFSNDEMVVMLALAAITSGILYYFKPETFPELTRRLPGLFVAGIQLMGRRTLEIYVAHLLLFKIWGLFYRPDRFRLFDWEWTQFGL